MQLGWVDFTEEERGRALDVLNLFKEQGTLDELGTGAVRDAFANFFFPGTSTVQTRAKYFLLVPYILREAAQGGYGNTVPQIKKNIDRAERRCALQLLKKNGKNAGVIGSRNLPSKWVARTPLSIYWSGIRTWGIFKENMSVDAYLKLSLINHAAKTQHLGNRSDDMEENEGDDWDAGNALSISLWNLPVRELSEDWMEEADITLTADEALFLKECILTALPDSLLAFLLKREMDILPFDNDFAALTEGLRGIVPDDMGKRMQMACDFNELLVPLRVRYNLILSQGENLTALEIWEQLSPHVQEAAGIVDIDELFLLMGIGNPLLRSFLHQCQNALIARDFETTDQLIKARECHLKGAERAKTNHPGEFNVDEWYGGYSLNYRMPTATTFIHDILEGSHPHAENG